MYKKDSFLDLGIGNSIVTEYLNNNEKIREFYSFEQSLEGMEHCAHAKHRVVDRTLLVDVLEKQFEKFDDKTFETDLIKSNIKALSRENVFTVTTGQQLHLFLGPAYFINKIYQCIKLVDEYNNKIENTKVIPVFWLASEDHDVEEIGKLELFGEHFYCKLPENHVTGRINSSLLKDFIEKVESRLGRDATDNKFFNLCKEAYYKFANLADATAYIIYRWFHRHGVLVVNADDVRFKEVFKPIAKNEISKQSTTGIQLEQKNIFDQYKWHFQVMPRGTNLFKISESNLRIMVEEKTYNPEYDYSPNALLRPIYQELILPNIAYVGGAAEVNYWLQLKPIFKFYNIIQPVIWFRDSLHVASAKLFNQIENLQFVANWTEEDYDKSILNLKNDIIPAWEHLIDSIKTELNGNSENKYLLNLKEEIQNKLVEYKKYERSIKNNRLTQPNHINKKNKIKKLQQLLFDKSFMQERNVSCLSLETNFNLSEEIERNYLTSGHSNPSFYLIGKEQNT